MGIAGSKLRRAAKQYNIEERAQKVISKEKPKPAPSYKYTKKQIEIAQEVNPAFMTEHNKRDTDLHDRLKQVFVSSQIQQGEEQESGKLLPQSRTQSRDFDYGFWEPDRVPDGRILLRDALKFMSDNLTDPKKHTTEAIALQYKLDKKDVENVLEYYRVFQVVAPQKDRAKPQKKLSMEEILYKIGQK